MISRSEIDQSHSELDLRMTEGDPINFNFLVKDASNWSTVSFNSEVKQFPDAALEALATLTVVVAAEGSDLDVKLTSAAVDGLTADLSPFVWGMKEVGGVTRFGGMFYVEARVV